MKLSFTKRFVRDYRELPSNLQDTVDKQLELLLLDQRHPSLNIKKMNDPRNIWEGRVTASYRFTFNIEGEVYVMRRVGTHDVLKKP
jgi:mRNA-degrading endonuclease RelE of RelBE toxin-antitoxin system